MERSGKRRQNDGNAIPHCRHVPSERARGFDDGVGDVAFLRRRTIQRRCVLGACVTAGNRSPSAGQRRRAGARTRGRRTSGKSVEIVEFDTVGLSRVYGFVLVLGHVRHLAEASFPLPR